MLPRLSPVSAPPAISGGQLLRPREVLAGEAVTRLQLVEPRSEPLVGNCWARVRLLAWLPKSAVLVFFSVTLASAHALASRDLTSVIERFKCASDLGGCLCLGCPPYRPGRRCSTPCASSHLRSFICFSFPSSPLWARHHQSSIIVPGLLRWMVAMCFLASRGECECYRLMN
jgi:hypothetical protein